MVYWATVGRPGTRPIVILHGLLGSGRNWQSIARSLNESLGRLIVTVDLCNHGRSVQFNSKGQPQFARMTWNDLADDFYKVLQTVTREARAERASVVGHSLGGEVVMQTLFRDARVKDLIDCATIVDIGPRSLGSHGFIKDEADSSSPMAYLHSMQAIAKHSDINRDQAMELFRSRHRGISEMVIQFIFTNYGKLPADKTNNDSNLQGFLLPVDGLLKAIPQLAKTVILPAAPLTHPPVLFIKGENSDYISDCKSIEECFSTFKLETVKGSGHWPHYENPQEFLKILTKFLNKYSL